MPLKAWQFRCMAIQLHLCMCIFLIGFMGSGKSYWGRKWAEKFNLHFIDLDEVIEKQSGETILQIFDKEGETAFRHLEKKILKNL